MREGDDECQQRAAEDDGDALPFLTVLHAAPCISPVMYEPSSSGVAVAGSSIAVILPSKITAIRSDRPISSSRSAEINRTPTPLSRAAGARPRSRPARRRRHHGSDARRAARGSRSTARGRRRASAGCRPTAQRRARRCPGVRTPNRSMTLGAVAPRAGGGDERPRWRAPGFVSAEHRVLPQRRLEQQAFAMAVERDVRDPELAAIVNARDG